MHIHVLMLCGKFELILIKIEFFTNFLSFSKIGPKTCQYCTYSLLACTLSIASVLSIVCFDCRNDLSVLPESLSKLVNLEKLVLSHNRIASLPKK